MTDAGGASTRWVGTWCVAVMLGGGLGSGPVVAADFDAGAGYSLAYSNNVTGVQTDPTADETQSVIAGFGYQDHTPDLNTHLLAQTERRQYLHKTFGPSSAHYVDGELVWIITPQTFLWTVQDFASEVRVDVTAADTPTNRTNTNSLSTGPDSTYRLTPTDAVAIGGRYGRFDIKGPGDNQRYSAYARWLRQLGPTKKLSLNYEALRVDFQDPPLTPAAQTQPTGPLYAKFLRQDAFAQYDLQFASTNSLTTDLGATRVQPTGGNEVSGRLARVTLKRRITQESSLRLSYADQFSDTFIDLLRNVTSSTVPTEGGPDVSAAGTNLISGDVYRTKRKEMSYLNNDVRMQYLLQGYIRSFDFETLNLDQEERGWRFEWYWLYSNQTQIHANSTYLKRTFLNGSSQQDRENNVTVGAIYKLNRNIGMGFEGGRFQRTSNGPQGGYTDARAMLFVTYSTGPRYTVKSRR